MKFLRRILISWLTLAALATGPSLAQTPAPQARPVSFENDVQPILTSNCAGCHGTATRIKEMNLGTLDGVMKGSESGPVVVPGRPDESRLFQMVRDAKMPPGKKHLSDQELASIRLWIESLAAPPVKAAAPPEPVTEHDIIPIMYLRCTVCHGLRRQEGGLDLRTRASMLKGGKSGPVIVPGPLVFVNVTAVVFSLVRRLPPASRISTVSVRVFPEARSPVELVNARWSAAPAITVKVVESDVSELAVAVIVIEPASPLVTVCEATPPDAVAVPSPVTVPAPPVFANVTAVVLSPVSRLPAASSTSTPSVHPLPEAAWATELVKER